MRYIPHTEKDIAEMLAAIGASELEELFLSIPEKLRLGKESLDLPAPLSETDLISLMRGMQKQNADPDEYSVFLGAGAYRHMSPIHIDALIQRGEFATRRARLPEISCSTFSSTPPSSRFTS